MTHVGLASAPALAPPTAATAPGRVRSRDAAGLLHSGWDAVLVGAAVGYAFVLALIPHPLVIAAGVWWGSNTVAHCFLHRPFFVAQRANTAFAFALTVLLGIPQELWKERHLAHHRGEAWRARPGPRTRTRMLALQCAALTGLWAVLALAAPGFLVWCYAPGLALGLGLCWLQGHQEHARGTTSHYGRLYNVLFANDGYHVEHHRFPGAHWRQLPALRRPGARASRWPPVLRWLDDVVLGGLTALEGIALHSRWQRRFLVWSHRRALAALLPPPGDASSPRRAGIVGGGLFPRTVLALRALLPDTRLVVIDRSARSIAVARAHLGQCEVEFAEAAFDPARHGDFDLLVFPLCFDGDRESIYRDPPARRVLVHDWIWRRRGRGRVVSWLLCKRVNLVERGCAR